ncbi:hypothetical protein [Bailinhaonella thermotolerans]|uniref:DUF1273 domain-containing protein n=1 Tax=Bailinhaonella thermotolerans TaxID=1070861 RepID=A0A3A4A7N2_9ACTN|nr:hypothetical protein [Bailinhaonella thermotolerans]RJL24021.1 hypothetical protein D5H75_31845 [Bailinhaonella thermotolerans]
MTRIGITGHSNLTDETNHLVYGALREAVAPYAEGGLVGISCLARGADQVFARVVLDLGGRLEVILPAPDYREEKVKPGNRKAFDELLIRAASVRYMPFLTSGREAYMAASEALLGSVDRLLAVWDGGPSGGFGGTADVVEQARRLGLPVEVIWPQGAERR